MLPNSLRQDTEQGFTLIELLVVILIIGILAAIAIPMFLNQRKAAAEATVKSDLKNAGTILEGQGKFTGTLPADVKISSGVTMTAMRTAERDNKVVSAQFVDGSAPGWGHFNPDQMTTKVSTAVFTNATDGYKGMNYRRITVDSTTDGAAHRVGQNVRIPLPEQGKKGQEYTVGAAIRHNYTGCRTLFIEYKNEAGEWPGGIRNKEFCFTKDQWQWVQHTGAMDNDGSDYVYLSLFGMMTAGQNMDVTAAGIVRGSSIDPNAILDTTGYDFCVQAYHDSDKTNIWRYSSLDGGLENKSC